MKRAHILVIQCLQHAVPPRVPFRKRKVEKEELSEDADIPLTLSDLLGGDAFVSEWSAEADAPPETTQKPPQRDLTVRKQPKREDSEEVTITHREDDQAMEVDEPPPTPVGRSQLVVGEGARDNRIIGNLHPLYDFEQNTARGDVITKAVADMGRVIPEIVAESFSTQRFDEALDCMRVMRKTALEV